MTDNPFELVLDRLREKGWHKGSFYGKNETECLLGAAINTGLVPWFGSGHSKSLPFIDLIKNEYPDRLNFRFMAPVPSFNDHPNTTFADVERVLEKAAVKWEEERVLRND